MEENCYNFVYQKLIAVSDFGLMRLIYTVKHGTHIITFDIKNNTFIIFHCFVHTNLLYTKCCFFNCLHISIEEINCYLSGRFLGQNI